MIIDHLSPRDFPHQLIFNYLIIYVIYLITVEKFIIFQIVYFEYLIQFVQKEKKTHEHQIVHSIITKYLVTSERDNNK